MLEQPARKFVRPSFGCASVCVADEEQQSCTQSIVDLRRGRRSERVVVGLRQQLEDVASEPVLSRSHQSCEYERSRDDGCPGEQRNATARKARSHGR